MNKNKVSKKSLSKVAEILKSHFGECAEEQVLSLLKNNVDAMESSLKKLPDHADPYVSCSAAISLAFTNDVKLIKPLVNFIKLDKGGMRKWKAQRFLATIIKHWIRYEIDFFLEDDEADKDSKIVRAFLDLVMTYPG